jgi:tetratricopeptide (TPR) repeat protein
LIAAIVLALWIWSQRTRGAVLADPPRPEPRAVIFASLWLALPLLLVLNLRVFPVDELVHDRYLYLPSVGFAILIALALRHLRLGRAQWLGRPAAQVLLTLALAAVLGARTVHQSLYWSDEYLLFSHSHEIAPRNNTAEAGLAAMDCERKDFPACIELSQEVLARDPSLWRANITLAYAYYELGKLDEAAKYFRRSIASNPWDGNQYAYLGLSLLATGHFKEAEAAVRRGLLIRPNGPNYHYDLGLILKAQGNLPAALAEFQAELTQDPGNERARAQAAETRDSLAQP